MEAKNVKPYFNKTPNQVSYYGTNMKSQAPLGNTSSLVGQVLFC